VLDEPTEGIQPSIIKQIGEVIRNLAARRDMAILLVEQYYDFAEALADRYMVMSREVIRCGAGSDMAGRCARTAGHLTRQAAGLPPGTLIAEPFPIHLAD
jgi:ABC-type branched-subunit amino acid transport system ATPase component